MSEDLDTLKMSQSSDSDMFSACCERGDNHSAWPSTTKEEQRVHRRRMTPALSSVKSCRQSAIYSG